MKKMFIIMISMIFVFCAIFPAPPAESADTKVRPLWFSKLPQGHTGVFPKLSDSPYAADKIFPVGNPEDHQYAYYLAVNIPGLNFYNSASVTLLCHGEKDYPGLRSSHPEDIRPDPKKGVVYVQYAWSYKKPGEEGFNFYQYNSGSFVITWLPLKPTKWPFLIR